MSEKLTNFEYIHTPHHLGMAAIRLVFQPSDKLEQSIQEFVKPEERRRYSTLLRSDEVKQLHYTGGDSSGLHYQTMNNSLAVPSDRDWLYKYKHDIDSIRDQTIPVAAYRPRLEIAQNGGLFVELALLPDEAMKRRIGQSLIRHLRGSPGLTIVDEVVYARAFIPKSQRIDDDAIAPAQEDFMEKLGVNNDTHMDSRHNSLQPSPSSHRMFVKTAFVSDKPVS